MKELTIEVFGLKYQAKTSSFKKKLNGTELLFLVAWNADEIPFPEDLESGKAIQEIFLALQEALVGEYNLEDWVFFPEPNESSRYFLTGVRKEQLPLPVAANPVRYWYDHTDDVWRTHY